MKVRQRPSISPSKITTYLACPVKYRWTYVDPRGKWYVRSRSSYSFGTTLHRVLELFHDSSGTGVETVGQALAAYEDGWLESGFGSAEEMAEAYGEGKAILERHVEESLAHQVTAKTLFVERLFRKDMGAFDLVGRIDRVDEHEDGTLEIIDYKSGRSEVSSLDVESDVSMGCYQLLLHAAFPGREIRATIYALRTGARASASMSASQLAAFAQDIKFIGEQMLGHDYEHLAPAHKRLCHDCDFLKLCRSHEDFAEPEGMLL